MGAGFFGIRCLSDVLSCGVKRIWYMQRSRFISEGLLWEIF